MKIDEIKRSAFTPVKAYVEHMLLNLSNPAAQ